MNDSAPASARRATGRDPELEKLRRANRRLTIARTSISGYSFSVTSPCAVRYVKDGEDPQAVINREFS